MVASKGIAALAIFIAAGGALGLLALVTNPARAEPATEADLEFFERKVRPILVRRCHDCHGERKQEASLRLDTRDALMRGSDSGAVLVPGSPNESRLVAAIRYERDVRMPPDGKLPDEEIAVLTEWVQRGAVWPAEEPNTSGGTELFDLEKRRAEHWNWRPVRDPPLPDVTNCAWPRDPIDRFILARLEAEGIEPAPEADRRTWLRRVSFDLTGLPAAPEEIDAFLADTSPDAYEKVVDQLLASPHFGERWARHWMDLVRYAETYGHEFDYPIPGAWRYRDYLIRAFNNDVPYDQFVKEHIAGDLLPEPRRHPSEDFNESIMGTAFWWLGEATHAPTDVRGDEAGRIDNQIDVFSKTFLGLTIACARCHDHKFDAVSTQDYYALGGFLQSSRRQVATLDVDRAQARLVGEAAVMHGKGDELLKEWATQATSAPLQQQIARTLTAVLEREVPATSTAQSSTDVADRWRTALRRGAVEEVTHPLFVLQHVVHAEHATAVAQVAEELRVAQSKWDEYDRQSHIFADFDGGSLEAWLPSGWAFGVDTVSGGQWDPARGATAIAAGGMVDSHGFHRKLHGAVRSPTFTLDHDTIHYRVRGKGGKIRLVLDGYFMNRYSALLFKDFDLDVKSAEAFTWQIQDGDLHRYRGHRAYIELEDTGDGWIAVDEIRFSNSREAAPPRPSKMAVALADRLQSASLDEIAREHARVLAEAVDACSTGHATRDQAQLVEWLLENSILEDTSARALTEELGELQRQIECLDDPRGEPSTVVAMVDGTAEDERVHLRGNHRTLGDVIPRRLPAALGGERPTDDEPGSGRLMLAERIASPENPLTARVMVNRIWHHLTGRGIVASVDNFGSRGTPPSHPDLLDHLATRFVREGWSLKRLIQAIVLSSTYRMASTPSDSGRRLDPANELMHMMRIRRLEGEAIRDAILYVSGRLDRTMYGPSIPVHLTEFMTGRGRPPESGPLDGAGRRSVYMCVRRNFLSPMMLAFDTPIPFTTIGRRNASNVPAQALILMNDPFVVDQARQWAQRLLEDVPGSARIRIAHQYVQAFGRPPTSQELDAAHRFLQDQAEEYGLDRGADSSEVRIWSDLCHVLLNAKEFILLY